MGMRSNVSRVLIGTLSLVCVLAFGQVAATASKTRGVSFKITVPDLKVLAISNPSTGDGGTFVKDVSHFLCASPLEPRLKEVATKPGAAVYRVSLNEKQVAKIRHAFARNHCHGTIEHDYQSAIHYLEHVVAPPTITTSSQATTTTAPPTTTAPLTTTTAVPAGPPPSALGNRSNAEQFFDRVDSTYLQWPSAGAGIQGVSADLTNADCSVELDGTTTIGEVTLSCNFDNPTSKEISVGFQDGQQAVRQFVDQSAESWFQGEVLKATNGDDGDSPHVDDVYRGPTTNAEFDWDGEGAITWELYISVN